MRRSILFLLTAMTAINLTQGISYCTHIKPEVCTGIVDEQGEQAWLGKSFGDGQKNESKTMSEIKEKANDKHAYATCIIIVENYSKWNLKNLDEKNLYYQNYYLDDNYKSNMVASATKEVLFLSVMSHIEISYSHLCKL